MPRKTYNERLDLPPLELECLKALWALEQGTVHDIRGALLPRKPLAYTTVMTLMHRLARKGIVTRVKRGHAHVYSPAVAETEVREHALARFLETFFGGSRQALGDYLGGKTDAIPATIHRPAGPLAPVRKRRPPKPRRAPATPPAGAIDESLL